MLKIHIIIELLTIIYEKIINYYNCLD